MIATLAIISIAFYWLLRETDYMRVRLPMGKGVVVKTLPLPESITEVKHNLTDTPYYWMTPEQKERHLMICHNRRCPDKSKCQKTERWTSWKLPAKTIKAFGSTLNLAEGCNIQRSFLLQDITREYKRKPVSYKPCQLSMNAFVESISVGSHQEWHEAIGGYKGSKGWHTTVSDYKTVFHDCLPGKEWLEAHYKDEYPEPSIDISCNGKSISLNGNFKKGMIAEFMSDYTEKVRAGKKTMTIQKGGHVENCGGGSLHSGK